MALPRTCPRRPARAARWPLLPLLVVLVLAAALPASGTETFLVNTGAPTIYDPFTIEDARTAGMGRVTAIPRDGMVATWWNPAFLPFQDRWSVSMSNADLGEFTPDGYIRSGTVSGPLGWGSGRLGVGLGLKRLSYGDLALGFPSGGTTQIWEQAYVAAAGYRLAKDAAIGVSLEYVWWHLDSSPTLNSPGSTGAMSASFGIGCRHPMAFSTGGQDEESAGRLTVTPMAAATFLHVGEKLDFGETSEDLYRQLRGAIGIDLEHAPAAGTGAFDSARLRQFALATAIEAWAPATEWETISLDRTVVHFGTELTLFGVLSGRIGFINDNLNNRVPWGSTHGIGISLPDGLPVSARFDWAAVPWGGSERIERRTLSISLRPRGGMPQ